MLDVSIVLEFLQAFRGLGFGAPFEAELQLGNQRSGGFTGDSSTCVQVRPKSKRESKSGTLTRGKSMQAKMLKPSETQKG